MPITCDRLLHPLNQDEFGKLSYRAFGDVLATRKELGRFFDEKHYKKALAIRRSDALPEEPILVSHDTFQKHYFLDVLLGLGGVLEFKAVEVITPRHKAQLMHYLMLAELRHGMLINVRPEIVTREFVNNVLSHKDRMQFEIEKDHWQPQIPGATYFADVLTGMLRDWGTCLDLSLYEAGLTHFFGGEEFVLRPAMVSFDGRQTGPQPLRFVTGHTAFKLTSFDEAEGQANFQVHAQKLVEHTDVEALLWGNVGRHLVTFRCLTKTG